MHLGSIGVLLNNRGGKQPELRGGKMFVSIEKDLLEQLSGRAFAGMSPDDLDSDQLRLLLGVRMALEESEGVEPSDDSSEPHVSVSNEGDRLLFTVQIPNAHAVINKYEDGPYYLETIVFSGGTLTPTSADGYLPLSQYDAPESWKLTLDRLAGEG